MQTFARFIDPLTRLQFKSLSMISTFGKWASALAFLVMPAAVQAQSKNDMRRLIADNLDFAVQQYRVLQDSTPADRMPRTFQHGRSVTSDTEWWCSGFYPGTLWYLYEYSKDAKVKAEAERRLAILEKENDTPAITTSAS